MHKGLVQATVDALKEIFINHRQAEKVVEATLKSNRKWGSRDRSFIAENTYEMVRWWRLITYTVGQGEISTSDQLWKVAGVWFLIKPLQLPEAQSYVTGLPDWEEFAGLLSEPILERYQQARQIRKIAQSIPDWMEETGLTELGDTWDAELAASNRPAPITLRVNTLKSDLITVQDLLGKENTAILPGNPEALVLQKRQNILNMEAYKDGLFEMQDAGSQLIAPFADPTPGQTIVDACAGAGGKTLHLAALMQNKGHITAMDIEERKLLELQKRATRNGVKNITTRLITPEAIQALNRSADRLLLDVPCSGMGVLRRNPDSKWKLTPQFLESIRKTQWHILSTYCQMVKKGGKMVYATCSLFPSESELQIQRFLQEYGTEWELEAQHRTSIAKDNQDGFYMARLIRKH